jgi:hypothetical protein
MNEQVMCFVGGSKRSFYCSCGCNVFTKFEYNRYRCNSCKETYTSDEDETNFQKKARRNGKN